MNKEEFEHEWNLSKSHTKCVFLTESSFILATAHQVHSYDGGGVSLQYKDHIVAVVAFNLIIEVGGSLRESD